MPISTVERLAAMLATLDGNSFDTLPPARCRQLAATMRHWAAIADRRADERLQRQQQGGVLADLGNGQRGE
jgi:hypothetical protein